MPKKSKFIFIYEKNYRVIYIGSEYLDDYINYAEDCIMAVSIFHNAKSYYVMKEIGYYIYNNLDKISNFMSLI